MTAHVSRRYGDHRPRSLALALLRDGAILLGGAAVVVALGRLAPVDTQAVVWLVGALALGLLAGLIGGASSFAFLLAGLITGSILDMAIRHPATADAFEAVTANAPAYAGAALIAVTGFVLARFVRRLIR